jgi:hypothetical protein
MHSRSLSGLPMDRQFLTEVHETMPFRTHIELVQLMSDMILRSYGVGSAIRVRRTHHDKPTTTAVADHATATPRTLRTRPGLAIHDSETSCRDRRYIDQG